MKEPTLVILAAGMGSRFGGLKQITAVDESGHAIIDFSLYDAYKAGFRKVCFIIKHEIEDDFKARIGHRIERYFKVDYVYQQLDKIPNGFSVPQDRVKPWGTGHAVACCKGFIDGPFAVINADDYYGAGAFKALFDFLSDGHDSSEHAIVAYRLKNTVTDNGYVARGICTVSNGYMTDVVEHTHIEKSSGSIISKFDNGDSIILAPDSPVSMNCWAFSESMLDELVALFPSWLETNLVSNPLKCEYYLPYAVNNMIKNSRGSVKVLNCNETWHGITYREDLEELRSSIRSKKLSGEYPEVLLD